MRLRCAWDFCLVDTNDGHLTLLGDREDGGTLKHDEDMENQDVELDNDGYTLIKLACLQWWPVFSEIR